MTLFEEGVGSSVELFLRLFVDPVSDAGVDKFRFWPPLFGVGMGGFPPLPSQYDVINW